MLNETFQDGRAVALTFIGKPKAVKQLTGKWFDGILPLRQASHILPRSRAPNSALNTELRRSQ